MHSHLVATRELAAIEPQQVVEHIFPPAAKQCTSENVFNLRGRSQHLNIRIDKQHKPIFFCDSLSSFNGLTYRGNRDSQPSGQRGHGHAAFPNGPIAEQASGSHRQAVFAGGKNLLAFIPLQLGLRLFQDRIPATAHCIFARDTPPIV